jgi:uncharacterized membrane protein (DUF485 family)
MPLLWRRLAWFASFAIAVALALWMRSSGYGWLATLGLAAIVWVGLPFVIAQICAAFVLRRFHDRMQHGDGLAERIAEAVKGLPPEQQVEVGKRMIDESFDKRTL